ncbi:hypothetical protein [Winogradskyella sp.]|jgi:hypothetical protein|uniref:hypothetical protein n=1 Tax=Winogradskyella sp. TaxID=1883156 RepID=UPI0025DF3CB4|nr:hypothetical protein [Winogradskyella sp.]MCT4629948.1 hypothetical protein [Winogradskyella sp.]
MKNLFISLFFLILILIPETSYSQAEDVLSHNTSLFEQVAQIAPISINPYTSVFVTAACSKAGFHNDFVSTHPFYNNWFVLILFGVLFLFTLIVRPVMATNQLTGTLVKVDNWLENKAGIVINALVILLPIFITKTPQDSEIVYQAGFISISFKAFLILILSTYVLFVIMTVRLFIDFLIFLSPIPFMDSALQIIKIVLSGILVVVSIVSPITSVVITVILFLISLIVFRRVKRLINRVTYFIVYPILNLFRKKESLLFNNNEVSILVFLKENTSKFKKGSLLRLTKQSDQLFLVNSRFLFGKKEEKIQFSSSANVLQAHFKTTISDQHLIVILNRSYHKYIDDIASHLNIKVSNKVETQLSTEDGLLSRVKQMFKKEDITQLKDI